jgi:hypothetical protein
VEETKTMIKKGPIIFSSVIGYIVAAIFNAILVVIKETNKSVFNWLKVSFMHHWIGQGVLVIVVFIVVLLITMLVYKNIQFTDKLARRLGYMVVIATLISIIIIAGFYAIEAI